MTDPLDGIVTASGSRLSARMFTLARYGGAGVGIGLFALAFTVIPCWILFRDGPPASWVLLWCIVPFGLLALAMFAGTRVVTVDALDRTLRTWWGPRVPLAWRTRSLDTLLCVRIADEERAGIGWEPIYCVRLEGHGPSRVFLDHARRDVVRAAAERLARHLDLPLYDGADPLEPGTQRRALKTLDDDLAEQARRTRTEPSEHVRPEPCRIAEESADGRIVFVIPKLDGRKQLGLLFAGALLTVPLALLYTGNFGGAFLFILIVSLMPTALAALHVLRLQRRSERIVVGDGRFRVEIRKSNRLEVHEMPLTKLEALEPELVAGSTRGDRVRSDPERLLAMGDHMTIRFGEGLSEQELRWLRGAIHAAAVAHGSA